MEKTGIQVGDKAPDFTLPTQKNETIQLSQFLGKKAVVLYFYPKDETPGCTSQACAFRDAYQEFQEAGAEVIGVSSDSIDSHNKFATNYRLPFILVSDTGGALRQKYGVPKTLGLLPGRVTYVIDKEGIVRHVFNSQLAATKHIDEALTTLKQMS
jgi:peroxiredoxin Q/BCP